MLVALTSAQRIQSLHQLSLDSMKVGKGSCTFYQTRIIKQSRPGYTPPVIKLMAYAPDRRLCVLTTLKEYLLRTHSLRGDESQLFISYVKPHKKISKDTLSRWIKLIMKKSGVDMDVFCPNSFRSASTSAAKRMEITVDDIMKVAGWSTEKTFAKYYNKPVVVTPDISKILK